MSDGALFEAALAIWKDFEGTKLAAKRFEAATFLAVTALNDYAKETTKAIKQHAETCKLRHQSYHLN